jgi:hypothetical protein
MGPSSSSWTNIIAAVAPLVLVVVLCDDDQVHCDFYRGNWISDESSPLYNTSSCPFIEKQFDCQNNGRPNNNISNIDGNPLPATYQG